MGSLAAKAWATDRGASVYLFFFFIKASPLTPETGAENSNGIFSIAKANSQNVTINLAKTEIPFFFFSGVLAVNSYHAIRVGKCQLRLIE